MKNSLAASLASLPQRQQAEILAGLTDREAEALAYDWPFWARPNQMPPAGAWRVWLLLAGRGFGKTRTGAEWVRGMKDSIGRIALVAPTAGDVRDVMVEGESGLLAISPPWDRPVYEPSKRRLTWPNGAMATTYSADEPDRLRGPQHGAAWCLSGDTLVFMADGTQKRLSAVRLGDLVATRSGPKAVLGSALTRQKAQVFRLRRMGGQSIIGTADHPVWVEGRGFVPLAEIRTGDRVCVTNASSGAVRSGIATAAVTTKRPFDCIAKYGLRPTDPYLLDGMSITSVATRRITVSKTWNYSPTANIARAMWRKSWGHFALRLSQMLTRRSEETANLACVARLPAQYAPRFSIVHQSIRPGFVRPLASKSPALALLPAASGRASIARNLMRRLAVCSGIAQGDAMRWLQRPDLLGGLKKASYAPNAARYSPAPAATQNSARDHAPSLSMQTIVSVEKLDEPRDVYDIAVADAHEFFANGILVHNCDEVASWRYPDAWDMLMFGLRLGDDPRCAVTTTPKPVKLIRDMLKAPTTRVTRGSTYDNRANLAAGFFADIVTKYEGTRLGRQELNAELLEDVPGALWSRDMIEASRLPRAPSALKRIVVAIDPAVTSGENADETGIIVAGVGADGRGYVLDDLSCRESPQEWAQRAVKAWADHKADRIVAEVNQGGDMVEATIRMVAARVPYTAVHASRGKYIRAEPISALYEQGKVSHVGMLATLEDQMCTFTPDFDRKAAGYSPDRLDALVWALTELMVDKQHRPARQQKLGY